MLVGKLQSYEVTKTVIKRLIQKPERTSHKKAISFKQSYGNTQIKPLKTKTICNQLNFPLDINRLACGPFRLRSSGPRLFTCTFDKRLASGPLRNKGSGPFG